VARVRTGGSVRREGHKRETNAAKRPGGEENVLFHEEAPSSCLTGPNTPTTLKKRAREKKERKKCN